MSDSYWMQQAYELALQAEPLGEVPVGAVLVDECGQAIGRGFNQVITKNDPTAHAEVQALREAAVYQQNYRLLNSTLYVTLEPCVMCAGAMVHARIKRLVFAARDIKVGAAGSVCNVLNGHPWNHPVQIDEGIMVDACAELLSNFFAKRR